MLVGVLQPTVRFKLADGKGHKKVTISDAQDSLVLRLPSLNDLDRQVTAIRDKFYSSGLTIQPFVICEGYSESVIENYYIYFDKNMYKFDSFLDAIVCCFNIFQICCLQYPAASELVWNFIQLYFFEISTEFDVKNSKISSLINYLKFN